MIDTREHTPRLANSAAYANPAQYGLAGGTYLSELPFVKAQHGSGAFEGKNDYDTPTMHAELAYMGYGVDGRPMPGTLATYQQMSKHPTIALVEASIMLTILAAEWRVEIDKRLVEDPEAIEAKELLEEELKTKRASLLRGMLKCLRYGWKSFEVVWTEKESISGRRYTGFAKFKQLPGEVIQLGLDKFGNLTSLVVGGITLSPQYFVHVPYDMEDCNWFGCSRNENVRRTWANYLHLEDHMMRLARKGSGLGVHVGVPAEDPADEAKGITPNRDAGKKIAAAVADAQPVVYTNLTGIDLKSMQDPSALAGKSMIGIGVVDVGNCGPLLDALIAALKYYDQLLVRGWLAPERTLTEATTGGSRADSESHGDMATADAEATHELMVEHLNGDGLTHGGPVKWFILENYGPRLVGRVRLVAMPLQDERRAQLAKFFDKLLDDPAFRTGLIKAMKASGVKGLIDKLGLEIALPDDFELEEPDDGQGGKAGVGDEDDAIAA